MSSGQPIDRSMEIGFYHSPPNESHVSLLTSAQWMGKNDYTTPVGPSHSVEDAWPTVIQVLSTCSSQHMELSQCRGFLYMSKFRLVGCRLFWSNMQRDTVARELPPKLRYVRTVLSLKLPVSMVWI